MAKFTSSRQIDHYTVNQPFITALEFPALESILGGYFFVTGNEALETILLPNLKHVQNLIGPYYGQYGVYGFRLFPYCMCIITLQIAIIQSWSGRLALPTLPL